ncbi:ArsR/SmtB family transcription factor [Desulfofustis limnaeus]|jgi:DNA-binding transcriptional ArsR family regulator|uniref:HTH arsR-type domain-containing protein n=1 Tax=Desulfofustis limnaeus TaxID=2740163 RepID=A0ABN6M4C0_9BACT|nr:metalloregulator ArsR/SmtB family transcription factor [Desulfofustis limnaeus]MDX9894662.1 metalloregulator ArsR/SmtB family transcription factor [Desulfofustis sp.]BDD87716.1 hypothetical protein DPPLL_20810 [Desulfofustis limnaeus]
MVTGIMEHGGRNCIIFLDSCGNITYVNIYSYKEVTMTGEDRCERRIIHEDRVSTARRALQELPPMAAVCDLFKALADPGRLTIVNALAVEEMCVCDLAALLGVSESAASHQMRLLRIANLVTNRREGQVLYYRLADDHVMQLVATAVEHAREARRGAPGQ